MHKPVAPLWFHFSFYLFYIIRIGMSWCRGSAGSPQILWKFWITNPGPQLLTPQKISHSAGCTGTYVHATSPSVSSQTSPKEVPWRFPGWKSWPQHLLQISHHIGLSSEGTARSHMVQGLDCKAGRLYTYRKICKNIHKMQKTKKYIAGYFTSLFSHFTVFCVSIGICANNQRIS